MEKVTSVSVMRNSDAIEIANGTSSKLLMYRAGLALFQSFHWYGKVTIVAGSGNNAGDGYVLALILQENGISCQIICTSNKFSTDGKYYFEKCKNSGILITEEIDFSDTDILVDCLLGTGFHGELRLSMRNVIQQINQSTAFILSVDINSGMNGDSGEGFCVQSDQTVSIGYLKYGHLLGMAQGKIKYLCNYEIGISCKGSFLPLFEKDSEGVTPKKWDFVPTEKFDQILDFVDIPKGTPAQRLQLLAQKMKDRIRFDAILDC